MGHDPIAKKKAAEGCPECGASLKRLNKHRVPGGADWYEYACRECGNGVTY